MSSAPIETSGRSKHYGAMYDPRRMVRKYKGSRKHRKHAAISQENSDAEHLDDGAPRRRRRYDPRRYMKSGDKGGATAQPPFGYLFLWVGVFKRWQKRWCIADKPGVLVHYKRMDRKGPCFTINLQEATLKISPDGNEREFCIQNGPMVTYCRTMSKEYRQAWIECIQDSIQTFAVMYERATKSTEVREKAMQPDTELLDEQVRMTQAAEERLAQRLMSFEPEKQAVEAHLQRVQTVLLSLSNCLSLTGQPNGMGSIPNGPGKQPSGEILGLVGDATVPSGAPTVSSYPSSAVASTLPTPLASSPSLSGGITFPTTNQSPEGSTLVASSPRFLTRPGSAMPLTRRLGDPTPAPGGSDGRPNSASSDGTGKGQPSSQSQRLGTGRMAAPPRPLQVPAPKGTGDDVSNWSEGQGMTPPMSPSTLTTVASNQGRVHRGIFQHYHSQLFAEDDKAKGKDARDSQLAVELENQNTWPRRAPGTFISAAAQVSSLLSPTVVAAAALAMDKLPNSPSFVTARRTAGDGTTTAPAGGLGSTAGPTSPIPARAEATVPGSASGGMFLDDNLSNLWRQLHEAIAQTMRDDVWRVVELESENSMLQKQLARLRRECAGLRGLQHQLQTGEFTPAVGSFESVSRQSVPVGDRYDEDVADDDELSDSSTSSSSATLYDADSIFVTSLADGEEQYFEALEVVHQHDYYMNLSGAKPTSLLVADAPKPEDLKSLATSDAAEETDAGEETDTKEAEEEMVPRESLPAPRPLTRGFNIWSILRDAIGKDLSRITLPATINEPLSCLQRITEELEYRSLVELACTRPNSLQRLILVATFTAASYNCSIIREGKPFNPLLGETYEWVASDNRCQFLTEQVSHHPPVSAYYAQGGSQEAGTQYEYYGEVEIKNKFWGRSIEVLPEGVSHLRLKAWGDHFSWTKVTTCIHNVVVGKMWIDNYGDILVKNHTTGEACKLKFLKAQGAVRAQCKGQVFDSSGKLVCTVSGNYMESLHVTAEKAAPPDLLKGLPNPLWTVNPALPNSDQQYNLTRFAVALNELFPKMAEQLAPTDSRFRPDQRALEEGDFERATVEKLRLEEKQRHARRVRRSEGKEWEVLWFTKRNPESAALVTTKVDGNDSQWAFNEKYWQAREQGDWKRCPDIY
eukprot:jgi/Mesvir1/28637/Mv04499-RA.1